MAKAIILLADGFEEVEAITVIDVLRRCDVELLIAGLGKEHVKSARGVKIIPDKSIDEVIESKDIESSDAVILPGGGKGVENLKKNEKVKKLLKAFMSRNKTIAAICAAPTALASFGLLKNRKATVYPGLENELKEAGAEHVDSKIVVDGNIITSKGPGTAFNFAFELAKELAGREKAEEVAKAMLFL